MPVIRGSWDHRPVDWRYEDLKQKEIALKSEAGLKETRAVIAVDKDGTPMLLFADWAPNAARPKQIDLYISAYYDKKTRVAYAPFELTDGLMLIVDIQSDENYISKNIGTLVLELAEDILITLGACAAFGELSPVDAMHRSRQVHFYKKNGYTVVEHDSEGAVRKHLV